LIETSWIIQLRYRIGMRKGVLLLRFNCANLGDFVNAGRLQLRRQVPPCCEPGRTFFHYAESTASEL